MKNKTIEPNLETKIRYLLRYEHSINVHGGCSFGDHWTCSCGERGYDSPSDHLAQKIMELLVEHGNMEIPNNP